MGRERERWSFFFFVSLPLGFQKKKDKEEEEEKSPPPPQKNTTQRFLRIIIYLPLRCFLPPSRKVVVVFVGDTKALLFFSVGVSVVGVRRSSSVLFGGVVETRCARGIDTHLHTPCFPTVVVVVVVIQIVRATTYIMSS